MFGRQITSMLVGVAVIASSAAGAVVTWPVAGWQVTGDDNTVITLEDTTDTTITISIEKTLSSTGGGEVPRNTIQFIGPTSGNTIDQIIVNAETVDNDSGFDWTGYRWEITPNGQVGFDSLTSAWTVTPFDPVTPGSWGSFVSGRAGSLEVSGGPVPHNDTFSPAGSLVIDVSDDPAFFSFKQIAVPEPVSATLMLLALPAIIARRRRK